MRAYQASRRGGEIICRLIGERVELQGACVFYLEGVADDMGRLPPSVMAVAWPGS